MGQLLYQGVAPSEIKAMGWKELSYWAEWSRRISNEESDQLEAAKHGH